MDALKIITEGMIKEEKPLVRVGDVVKVHVKIREGERERIQVFEGTVIARKSSGVAETFTVRRLSHGVGVERVFPINSPNVDKVELVRAGKV
ncbi:MAG: 50S ribosomal protein L19, partial [Oscillospiraceae bacterium]